MIFNVYCEFSNLISQTLKHVSEDDVEHPASGSFNKSKNCYFRFGTKRQNNEKNLRKKFTLFSLIGSDE